ncbi:MAG: gliding motility-associated C-terminal domain-containing protein [Cyclobacteriaceae bacterium]
MKRSLFIILILPFWLFGQNIQNVESPMIITDGTILQIDEDFVNTGDVLNEGQLIVGGRWVNVGIYRTSGAGILELNGPLSQAISDLAYIDKLRLSGGDKTLSSNLRVDRLELNGSKLIISDEYSLEITASGTISRNPGDYIIGRLVMTGPNTFPVGTANRFLPVYLEPLTDSLVTIGIKAVESKLEGALPASIADLAPFHWVMDESDELFNVQLGFEDADFLMDTVGNALVVESESLNSEVMSLFQKSVTGSLDSMAVSNGATFPLSLPYFSVGRKYTAEEKPPLKVYNLVSPNGDGINDFLYIENLDSYLECSISIFDRWGSLVFSQTGYDNRENVFRGQNNILNNKELVEGAYYYVIRYKGKKIANGFFELTR